MRSGRQIRAAIGLPAKPCCYLATLDKPVYSSRTVGNSIGRLLLKMLLAMQASHSFFIEATIQESPVSMRLLRKQWFLFGLAAMLAAGLLAPQMFQSFADHRTARSAILTTVLFLMAFPLEASAVWRTVKRPWAALLGSVMNYGACPLLAWLASTLLTGDFAIGMMVAAAAPCTLASAAVWTRRAGGNDVTALLVTLLTNGACFLLTPFWLAVSTQTEARLDVGQMISRLAFLVVLPMTLAQLVRLVPGVATRATRAKPTCSTIAQLGILSMVLIGAVKCSEQLSGSNWMQEIGISGFATMVVVVTAVHLGSLWIAYQSAQRLGFERAECIAVAFAGSQKTLMIGLYVAIEYFGGLVILPMVVYHISQLVLDTLIGEWFSEKHP